MSSGLSNPAHPGGHEDKILRDTLIAIHRATTNGDDRTREPAIRSLVTVAVGSNSLLVLQSWLDQFTRTNGGSSTSEYAAQERVFLLQSLETVIAQLVDQRVSLDEDLAHRACVGRIVAMATEEMTRQPEVIPDIQKPCSNVLVKLGHNYMERVMDALLVKFQPGSNIHFYVLVTLGSLAQANSMDIVPFLKAILGTVVVNLKSVKKENLRYAYALIVARSSEAIMDYLANMDDASDPSVTKEHFEREVDLIHELFFNVWLGGRDLKVKHSILEGLAQMACLLSTDRLSKVAANVVSALIATYKRTPDHYYVTLCISQTVDAAVKVDPSLLESVMESLLTALFNQICTQSSADYTKPLTMKNHHEVLRCYDILVRTHKAKLVAGLVVRSNSVDESIRLAALTVFKHILTTSLSQVEDKMDDIFRALHTRLGDGSNKVRKMLAQLTAQLGRLGYLKEREGKDFLDFVVRVCALPSDKESTSSLTKSEVSCDELKEICDNILQLWSTNESAMDMVLWPHLLDYLLLPELSNAVPSVIRSLSQLATKKKEEDSPDFMVDYVDFKYIAGPYVIVARLFILAAVPFPSRRGVYILEFLQKFAPNINKHIPSLWKQRISLLQHYLEKHVHSTSATWDQFQWEEWLLALLEDTIVEIGLDEWTTALASSMCQQLALYQVDKDLKERCFLMRSLGLVLKRISGKQLILEHLSSLFSVTNQSQNEQQMACAQGFGLCASRHLPLVLDKLESLLKMGAQKRSGSFFGLLRDSKSEESLIRSRCTILLAVGQAAAMCSSWPDLAKKLDEITQKFIMPALKSENSVLKVSSLRAMTDIAQAVLRKQSDKSSKGVQPKDKNLTLAHHGDLIHEAIECLNDPLWSVADKLVALSTINELIRIPPFLAQMTRYALLKACFTAVFPGLLAQFYSKEENYADVIRREASFKQVIDKLLALVQELLKQEMEQSTLDEIFTLLEPWLKKEVALAKEMAITVFQRSLGTYLAFVDFKVGAPTAFAPGPYMLGSIIPRCFDASRGVQKTALECIQLLIKILATFDGHAKENIEDMLSKMRALCALSPREERHPLDVEAVSKTLSEVLCERVQHSHLLALIHSLVDGLSDELPSSSLGASIVLGRVIESRGNEVYEQAPDLVQAIQDKLSLHEGCDETRIRMLTTIRVLASRNGRCVVEQLLMNSPLPLDDSLDSIWKVFTHDSSLAHNVLKQLLRQIDATVDLCSEEERTDHLVFRIARKAKYQPLAAVAALCSALDMKEMEILCENEFASILVALLATMSCYVGVHSVEKVKPKLSVHSSLGASRGNASGSPNSPSVAHADKVYGGSTVPANTPLNPLETAKSALRAFFDCQSCDGASGIVGKFHEDFIQQPQGQRNIELFTQFVLDLVQTIVQDHPQHLSKLVLEFQPLLTLPSVGRRTVAVAFFCQILRTDTVLDRALYDAAVENLLAALKSSFETDREEDERQRKHFFESGIRVKILCLKGLSHYRRSARMECDGDSPKYGPVLLTAFMDVIGEDFKSDLNQHALDGLSQLLESKSIFGEQVHKVMSEMANRIRPFFDCGNHEDCASAIQCFSKLTPYATGQYQEVFLDQVQSVIISLLLHANDDVERIQRVSHGALKAILEVYTSVHEAEGLPDLLAHLNSGAFNYGPFLLDLARSPLFQDDWMPMFPAYVDASARYFHSSNPNLRASAICLLSTLVAHCQSSLVVELKSDAICQGLATLLADKSPSVRAMAATHVGKVLIALKQARDSNQRPNLPKAVLDVSDSDTLED